MPMDLKSALKKGAFKKVSKKKKKVMA